MRGAECDFLCFKYNPQPVSHIRRSTLFVFFLHCSMQIKNLVGLITESSSFLALPSFSSKLGYLAYLPGDGPRRRALKGRKFIKLQNKLTLILHKNV